MNSNVADINISALLNMGAKPSRKEFEVKVDSKDESFDRHLSEQSQKKDRSTPEDRVDRTPRPDNQSATAKQAPDHTSGSESESASKDDAKSSATVSSDTEAAGEHKPAVADDKRISEGSSEEAANEAFNPALAVVDDVEPLVPEHLGVEEVLVDVPADASISLETIVKAVSSATDPLSPEAESVDAVLDDLVQTIVPANGAPTTPSAANQAAGAIAASPEGLGRPLVPNSNTAAQGSSAADTEGLELPEMPLADSKVAATKSSEASVVQGAQLPPVAKAQIPPALTAAVANAVDAVVKEVAGAKPDVSSSTREASPLVAVSQRGGTRPLNVQQGNAQFSMPTQAKAGQPQWQTAVAERVAVMASQRITSAEIQLDPPELGQLQVRVTLNQEQASVSFASQHAVVREALDQTAHRLRDMFDAEGLDLVDVDVSDQSFNQEQGEESSGGEGFAGSDEVGAEPELVKVSRGLVDQFV